MTASPIPMAYFVPAGKALLLASGGFRVVQSLRKDKRVEPALMAFAIGMLGITFYSVVFEWVHIHTEMLEKEIGKLGDPQSIKNLIVASLKAGADEYALADQVFRLGIWGIFSAIGDLIFILAETFIKVKRELLLTLIEFLFPLIWGLYPVFPKFGNAILGYTIEIFLWGPCLALVYILSGYISHRYMTGTAALPGVAIEIIVALLVLNVPRTVHQLLGGALFPDGETAALSLLLIGSKVAAPLAMKQVSAWAVPKRPLVRMEPIKRPSMADRHFHKGGL